MKKNNPNYNLSKSLISDALFTIMKTKHINKITVKEVSERAEIARRTFYKHFDNLEDVIEYKLHHIDHEFTEILTQSTINSPEEYGTIFFSFFKNYADILLSLHKYNLLFSKIYYMYKDHMDENEADVKAYKMNNSSYNISYRFGGIFFMLIDWLEQDCKETPKEMGRLLALEINEIL